jgi:PAS domain S-box-containing protein
LSELGVFQAGAFDFDALRNVPGDRFAHSASVPLETKRGRALLMEIMGQAYTVNGKRLTQCNFRDITARKRAEEQARRNLELAEHSREALAIALEDRQQDEAALRANEKSHYWLAAAVEQAVETIVVTDAIGTILYANPAFEKATGYTCAEVLGKNSRILKSGQHDAAFYRRLWDVLTSGQVWRGHFVNRRKDGTLYQVGATISPVRDASGTIVNYVSVHRNCEPYPAA